MSPSQEILNSIEERLRQLAQEIAALESDRAKLQSERSASEISEEEWLERRAAELAAQSRKAAAA